MFSRREFDYRLCLPSSKVFVVRVRRYRARSGRDLRYIYQKMMVTGIRLIDACGRDAHSL